MPGSAWRLGDHVVVCGDSGVEATVGNAFDLAGAVAADQLLTDPPYGDESGPLYEWLGEWAARVLVPGGSLICYTGQSRLPRDLELLGAHLRYWWLLEMLHTRAQRLPGKFVMVESKPVLWFVKGHRRGNIFHIGLLDVKFIAP